MLIPVIIAGGSGTRLWPLSRAQFPKQFLNLFGELTMLQQTLSRLDGLGTAPPIVLCNEEHRFIVAEQLRQIGVEGARIILEPVGRNTAPAIAIAAFQALKEHEQENSMLLVLAADHLIEDVQAFHQAIFLAQQLSSKGDLVTFGIVPSGPETGYGYIEKSTKASCQLSEMVGEAYEVKSFIEKPDQETANQLLQTDNFYWNSGMFLFQARDYLDALKQHKEVIYNICQQAVNEINQQFDFERISHEIFSRCPSESIDCAVMERADNVSVVTLDAGWSDIGSWSALWEIDAKDHQGNATKGDVIIHDSYNSLIHAESRLVATIGVENLAIIETKDAVLIADRECSQDVKVVVEKLKREQRCQSLHHRVIYRPWGSFDSIEEGERFKVKRITVKPGEMLSLQMHHHRAEHWVVVSGTAKVTHNGKIEIVTENESIYIHVGEVHALENPGKVLLELIEVQTGSYLGEDDIVRLDDRYGREGQ